MLKRKIRVYGTDLGKGNRADARDERRVLTAATLESRISFVKPPPSHAVTSSNPSVSNHMLPSPLRPNAKYLKVYYARDFTLHITGLSNAQLSPPPAGQQTTTQRPRKTPVLPPGPKAGKKGPKQRSKNHQRARSTRLQAEQLRGTRVETPWRPHMLRHMGV